MITPARRAASTASSGYARPVGEQLDVELHRGDQAFATHLRNPVELAEGRNEPREKRLERRDPLDEALSLDDVEVRHPRRTCGGMPRVRPPVDERSGVRRPERLANGARHDDGA